MKYERPCLLHQHVFHCPYFILAFLAALAVGFATGCSSGGNSSAPASSGNTTVTLLASSTANDQLSQFTVTLQSLTLISQSGNNVALLPAQESDEFIHLNGNVEPLASVSVPQDVYTSAIAAQASSYPACVGPGIVDEEFSGPGIEGVAVNLPVPITVTGTAMGLVLNLQASASAPFSGGCSLSLASSVPVAPIFSLTPVAIAAQPTNSTNGKALGLNGLIGSINASGSLSVNALSSMNSASPPSWQVRLNSSTVFQGVSGPSQLAAGMPVNMDLAVQADGTLLATRIAVLDTNAANLSVASGPPTIIYSSGQKINIFAVEQQGNVLPEMVDEFSFGNATFQISPQFTNLQSLPFTAAFNAANMVDGQNIFYTTHAQSATPPTPASTMTLLPQTINGTVSAISNSGSFTVYTVTLAPYDLFTDLAVQPGQTTLLTDPGVVVVYADSNTQMLSTSPAAVGSLLRFYGLVFNDNGTLRMDCAQVNDGVTE